MVSHNATHHITGQGQSQSKAESIAALLCLSFLLRNNINAYNNNNVNFYALYIIDLNEDYFTLTST